MDCLSDSRKHSQKSSFQCESGFVYMELSERCIQVLEKEGFLYVYEWKDEAGTIYPVHNHQDKVTIFVTEGTVEIVINGQSQSLKAGDRLDIPPQVPHSGVVGMQGCQYVVGEMIDGDS